MIPTDHEVYNQIRALMGEASTGSRPSNSTLHPFLNASYQTLFGKLRNLGAMKAQREVTIMVHALQSRVPLDVSESAATSPYTGPCPNLGYIKEVWERKGALVVPEPSLITSSGGLGSVQVTTAVPHGLSDGDSIQLTGTQGFGDAIEGTWAIDVEGATIFRLRGCVVDGTMVTSGHLYKFSQSWQGPLTSLSSPNDIPTTPQSSVAVYCFQDGYLFIPPQSGDPSLTVDTTQLKILYSLSGKMNSPTTTPIPTAMDDSLNFLSEDALAKFLEAKGSSAQANIHRSLAQSALLDLLRPHVKQFQLGEPISPPAFRAPRNVAPTVW